MKILFVNESTKIKGGVDTVLQMEIEGLRENGVEVDLFEFAHSEFLNGKILEKVKNINLYFSEEKKIEVIKEKLNSFKPDIVHFHNTYPFFRKPLWSDKIFEYIKVVQHLHNYYPFCLNSFFYRDEKICTECFDNNSFQPGIKNACYDYSKMKSILAAYNRPTPKEWIDYSKNVDLFLGVSQFVVDKYVEFGVDENKVKKLYNGISIEQEVKIESDGSYVLFLGNIVNSKGVEIVCKLAERNKDINYKIAGLGRDLSSLKEKYNYLPNLTFEGYVAGKRKKELLENSRFLIFPVQSWEAFGIVVIEALFYGKKIIVSGLGGTSELVEEIDTCYIVKDNDLKCYEKVHRKLWDNFVDSRISIEKQKEILSKFYNEMHIKSLIKYYKSIL